MGGGSAGRVRWSAWLLMAPSIVAVTVFIVLPIGVIGLYSFWQKSPIGLVRAVFTLENWGEFFGDRFYLEVLWHTVRLSAVATAVAALLGYPVAYTLSRMGGRWRGGLLLLLFLPSWISIVVRTMSWLHVLGPMGLVNLALLRLGLIIEPLPLLYNDVSIYIGLVQYILTYMILNVYIGLQAVDRSVVEAARTLGASDFQSFLAVTLPLSLPGLLAGCLLCFVLSAGSYITPMLLGGPGNVYFANLIYDTMVTQLDWPFGATLALVFVGLLMAMLVVYGRLVGFAQLTKRAA